MANAGAAFPGKPELGSLQRRSTREDDVRGCNPRATLKPDTLKYYAVRAGRRPGIYRTWPDCMKDVIGFPGARYKSFYTLFEVETFLRG